jgi:tRNA threonylcarbamoyladenosine biosynthesis protein TsaE
MSKEKSFKLKNADETLDIGFRFSKIIDKNLLIFLKGNLGAGKTTFVRGLIHGLGFQGRVKSPSYSLFEQYLLKFTVNHFDLYRFKSSDEWIDAGFNEFINGHDVNLIEWPEMAENVLPSADIILNFEHTENDSRELIVISLSDKGNECLSRLN